MTDSGPSSASSREAAASADTGFGQATVHTFDEATQSGSVITDNGVVIPFSREALLHSRLLTLRVGQRLRVSVSASASGAQVTALTLATFKV
jgi:2-phospho-L-lactate guanylyltransferase